MRAHSSIRSAYLPASSVWYNLATILLALLLLGVGAAYLLDAWGRSGRLARAPSEATLSRTLSGQTLEIPAGWFRYEETDLEGFSKQIDLRLQLPLGIEGRSTTVDVTLVPRSRVRPSASLLDGVYLHQFEATQLSGPVGLVGKPLRAGEGYDGETVWYDPLNADPFVAKCSTPVTVGDPATCLRTVLLGPGMAAVYTFDAEALVNWRNFDAVIDARLSQIGAL